MEEEWQKPASERAEWIVWADTDTLSPLHQSCYLNEMLMVKVVLNPTIRLESFLPPGDAEDVYFVFSKGESYSSLDIG